MRSAASLNKLTTSFDYFDELKELSFSLIKEESIFPMEKELRDGNGLFQRLYWGMVCAKDLPFGVGGSGPEQVIVSVNFSNINSPKLRYYFFDKKTRAFYEVGTPPKKLGKLKSSRSELVVIHESLPVRFKDELLQLESEISEWCKLASAENQRGLLS